MTRPQIVSDRAWKLLAQAVSTALVVTGLGTVWTPSPAASLGGVDADTKAVQVSNSVSLTPPAAAMLPQAPAKPGKPGVPSRVRELTERRTQASSTYLLSDGTVELVASADPVHYRDHRGRWQEIDTTVLSASSDVAFENRSNTFVSRFGRTPDDLASITALGHTVSIAADATNAEELAPTNAGSTVTFPDVFGASDVRYTVNPSSLKEDILVPNKDVASETESFRFKLDVGDLEAKQLSDGSIVLFDESPRSPQFVIPAPSMTDAKGASTDRVTQKLTGSEGEVLVEVTPDQAWITHAARAFPVAVDPTLTVAQQGTTDARIYQGAATTAYPSDGQIPVGRNSSGMSNRGLFQFDLSGIPAGIKVKAARLNLHMSSAFAGATSTIPLTAHPITSEWSASTATWASMNSAYSTQVGQNEFVIDDPDVDNVSSGPWKDVANSAAEGGSQAKLNSGTTADTFEWNARIPWSGSYRVEAHIVPATGQGSPTYVATGDTGSTPSVALSQTTGTTTGVWKQIAASLHASPGKTTRVKMTRQGGTTATSPVADAVRWLELATSAKQANERDNWHSYGVGTTVQAWIDGTMPNHGFMVKATDESSSGPVGGPNYEAAESVFGGETANRPQLVVIYDEPGPALAAPLVVQASGSELTWSAYNDPSSSSEDNLAEYQIWRGCVTLPEGACQTSAPTYFSSAPADGLELLEAVDPGVTAYTDTTAKSSTATEAAIYRYWVVARTAADEQNGQDGRAASNEQTVTIPREGRIVRAFTGNLSDSTLSSAQATTNLSDTPGLPGPETTQGTNYRHWLQAGNSHAVYGDERAVLEFDTGAVKRGVKVTGARLELWESSGTGSGGTFDLHALTRDFAEAEVTWNQATSTIPWTTAGGDIDPAVLATLSTDNAAKRLTFESAALRGRVQTWVSNPDENHGLLLKAHDETVAQQYLSMVNSEATDTLFRPRLVIEHLIKNDAETIEAPQMPERFVPGTITKVPVTVTNTTDAAWPGTLQLSYRWTDPGQQTDLTTEGSRLYVPLGRALEPGESVSVELQVRTPINSDTGAKRLAYDLYLDLWDTTDNGYWWSDMHPLSTNTTPPAQDCSMVTNGLLCVNRLVEDPTSNLLGLEKFASYTGEETGGGSQALTNLASGNLVWSYDAMSNLSIGPSAFVRLAYNSMDQSDAGAGYGVSVQASTLNRYGSRLSVPSGGSTSNLMTFIDGDGTTHTYKLATQSATKLVYDRPAGVPLTLIRDLTADPAHQWVFSRADGTRFYFSQTTGLQTSTVDRNGNTMSYQYDPAGRGLLTAVTDGRDRTVLKLGYDAKGLTWIQDISCRALKFTYNGSHQLTKIEDGGRFDPAAGTFGTFAGGGSAWCTAPAAAATTKSFGLTYNTDSLNSNATLISVRDPRDATSEIAYWGSEVPDSAFTLWVKSFTDRRSKKTTYAYSDWDGSAGKDIFAKVTDENGTTPSVTSYLVDGFGRTTAIKDANANATGDDDATRLGWDRDHNVIRLEEPNGAVSTWEYDNATGYPTRIKDALAVKSGSPGIVLEYAQQFGPGAPWVLTKKTTAAGRVANFTYDSNGNLLTVRDGNNNGPTYTYNPDGTLDTVTDANDNVTDFGSYHASGGAFSVTDAMQHQTQVSYAPRGDVLTVTDALAHVSTTEYDDFGRPVASSTPGTGAAPRTTRVAYDVNDNVTEQIAPTGAATSYAYNAADLVTTQTLPDNNVTDRKLTYSYDDFGRVVEETAPEGQDTADPDDFVTRYSYDRVGQVLRIDVPFEDTDGSSKTASTKYTYDKVGNLSTEFDPKKTASGATDYSRKTIYDLNHRPTSVIDAAGYTTKTEYDADGLVTAEIDAFGNRRKRVYDPAGRLMQIQVPRTDLGSTEVTYKVTKFDYDDVGNLIRKTRPTGFYSETHYDALNRPEQTKSPFKTGDPDYGSPANTFIEYDEIGRMTRQSLATPSTTKPTATNQWTEFTYYDSGDIKSTTDPWSLITTYDYDQNGQQTSRTFKNTGDDATRSQSWSYYDDGSLKSKSDTAAQQPVDILDNAESHNTSTTGTWATVTGGTNTNGANYRTHAAAAAGTTAAGDTFTWKFTPDIGGPFDVYASCPVRTDATTNAAFTVNHANGSTASAVNQKACTSSTPWVKLGSFTFNGGTTKTITLKPATSGVVIADAIKFVATGPTDKKTYAYAYDANGLSTTVTDSTVTASTFGVKTDTYKTEYDGLGRPKTVQELLAGTVRRTTNYTYDLNSNLTSSHADRPGNGDNAATSRYTAYTWDSRNLVDTVETGTSPTSALAAFEYTYDARGMRTSVTKPNGNVAKYTYYEDGLLRTSVERTANNKGAALVASHTLHYNADGDRTKDVSKVDQAGATGTIDQTAVYDYTPSQQLASVTKTGADAGADESYTYGASGNVIEQTVDGVTTTMKYDRNRLTSTTTPSGTFTHRYDAFGRNTTVTFGAVIMERHSYDGFDREVRHQKYDSTGSLLVNKSTAYDPLDRTALQNTAIPGKPTVNLRFTYLGTADQIALEEQKDTAGVWKVSKAYAYGPGGEKLQLVDSPVNGTTTKTHYYGTNPHGDVETLTDASTGQTTSTYRYTAYGSPEKKGTTGGDAVSTATGVDKVAADADMVNPYRFNAKRFDGATGGYDMGFRNYSPEIGRFLTRDMYNGALSDMALGADPWNTNRYMFTGGNPITGVELDGHQRVTDGGGGGDSPWADYYESLLHPEESYDPSMGGLTGIVDRPVVSSNEGGGMSSDGSNSFVAPPVAPFVLSVGSAEDAAMAAAKRGLLGRTLGVLGLVLLAGGDSVQNQTRDIDDDYQNKCFRHSTDGASIYYFPLDDKGRATGAMACLEGGIPFGLRDTRATHTPEGFVTNAGMHRSHLIAKMLGGSNADPRNIVPLYGAANLAMLHTAEYRVASAALTQTVYYTVVPTYSAYSESPLLPVGVTLRWVGSQGASGEEYIPNVGP